MKVRTNLTPSELKKVSKGLEILAEKQQTAPYVADNNAESELLRRTYTAFDEFVNDIQEDVADILLGKSRHE